MGELDNQLNKVMFGATRKLMYETNGGFYVLNQYATGNAVRLELVGEEIADGIQTEPDQVIEGHLTNAPKAFMQVEAASHRPDIIGKEIGLGICSDLPTPGGVVYSQNLRNCVSPGRSFSYFFVEDVPAISKYGTPQTWHNLAARYSRVVIGDVELFNVSDV